MAAVIAAVAFARGMIPGSEGCVLRSVDKSEYVARNEEVFRTIELPSYLRDEASNTSVGISSPQACLPFENGPPYSSYVTWHVYLRPAEGGPYGFDRRLLGREWVSQLGGSNEETFRRGDASLHVSTTDETTTFAVDHRAYAGH